NYADIKLAAIPVEPSMPVMGTTSGETDRPPLIKGGLQGGATENHSDLAFTPSLCKEGEFAGKANDAKLVQLTLPARSTAPSPVISGAMTGKPTAAIPPKPHVLHYAKEGPARFLSHLNVMKLMEQAMIRAGMRLRFTEGFNPHPKFATSPAIPLGMASQ